MKNIEHTYIKETSTQNTGGNVMVDFVELKNGNVIGISDDCVVLYKSKDWWEGGTESKALYFDEIGE
tara:strand:- start:814 stop:1014 length:201 start_codon:yes stop_codon:yes gene_type:complete